MRDFPIELSPALKLSPQSSIPALLPVLGYGWALDREAHVAVPNVLLFFMSLFPAGPFGLMSVLLTDLYPSSPSTATAADNLVRSFMGAAGTAVIIQMVDGMGRSWCSKFVAGVLVAMSPLLWVDVKWGTRWREARRVRVEKYNREKRWVDER